MPTPYNAETGYYRKNFLKFFSLGSLGSAGVGHFPTLYNAETGVYRKKFFIFVVMETITPSYKRGSLDAEIWAQWGLGMFSSDATLHPLALRGMCLEVPNIRT